MIIFVFRYPSQPMQVPPGQHHESPTEQYWNSLPADQQQQQQTSVTNHMNSIVYPQQQQQNNINMNNNIGSITEHVGHHLSNHLQSTNSASPNYFDRLTTVKIEFC